MSDKTTELRPEAEPARKERARGRLHQRLHANPALGATTKIVVTVLGVLVILAGLVMMVAPGPGIVAVILGLAILATEWDWADRWLQKAREQARRARAKAEAMDPKVRRRRLLLTGAGLLVVFGAGLWYVVTFGWPDPAVDGWDWVQSIAGWIPELPGPTADSINESRG